MRAGAAELAARGVYVGTSSWKYRGWAGMLYDDARYIWRGKFSEARFEKHCLREYAEVFKTVCFDGAYYFYPSQSYLEDLAAEVPPDFRFGFKVTEEITVKKFPNLARFGARAGQASPDFLNADRFIKAYLEPLKAIRSKVGLLMFEFSRFYPTDYARGRDFLTDLDRFLEQLPRDWPYGIELRNRAWLGPDYFACLSRHQVAHVFNSWSAMPAIGEQMALPGSRTNPDLCAARLLLRPGRSYAEAVATFQPYNQTKEPYAEARSAAAAFLQESLIETRRKTYLYVNNRLEGNALETLDALLNLLQMVDPKASPKAPDHALRSATPTKNL